MNSKHGRQHVHGTSGTLALASVARMASDLCPLGPVEVVVSRYRKEVAMT